MKFNATIQSTDSNNQTKFEGATISYLIDSLKKLESSLLSNEIQGSKVFGNHNNSRNVKKTPNDKF